MDSKLYMKKAPKIAIAGRLQDTHNYEKAMNRLEIPYKTSLSLSEIRSCDGLLLPGGGDITPAFFGQKNIGSKKIDTELDIIQLQAVEQMLQNQKPILGICKGMQIINVYFGGTIIQHMKQHEAHEYTSQDQYHESMILKNTFLYSLYGDGLTVNSAHHQCIGKPGHDLNMAQYSIPDQVPEALYHSEYPIFGVQWHPERLFPEGDKLLLFFYSLLS